MREACRRWFATGRAVPLPGAESSRYQLRPGTSEAQIQRHIVRDAASALRREFAREKRVLWQAAQAERASERAPNTEREERTRLKQNIAKEKQSFYAALHAQEAQQRLAAKQLKASFWNRKQSVLAEARKEMIRCLSEDASLWEKHPREMMNRRYKTLGKKHFLSALN